jgi:hypothetical protein
VYHILVSVLLGLSPTNNRKRRILHGLGILEKIRAITLGLPLVFGLSLLNDHTESAVLAASLSVS